MRAFRVGMKKSKKVIKKSVKKSENKPVRSKDIPATQGMLYRVRDELKHETVSLRHDMNSGFKHIDARFERVEARFEKIDAQFERVEAKLETVISSVHRVGLIVEEQNARNKYVLDGYAQLWDHIKKPKDV